MLILAWPSWPSRGRRQSGVINRTSHPCAAVPPSGKVGIVGAMFGNIWKNLGNVGVITYRTYLGRYVFSRYVPR